MTLFMLCRIIRNTIVSIVNRKHISTRIKLSINFTYPDELSDATAALDWIERQNLDYSQCWVSGFSFGSLICMQLIMRRPEVNNFISVSPQPNVYDFSFLAPCPTSGQVIYSENDELVTKESIIDLNNRIKSQKGVEVPFSKIKNSNHFFKNKEKELTIEIEKYIKEKTALI